MAFSDSIFDPSTLGIDLAVGLFSNCYIRLCASNTLGIVPATRVKWPRVKRRNHALQKQNLSITMRLHLICVDESKMDVLLVALNELLLTNQLNTIFYAWFIRIF